MDETTLSTVGALVASGLIWLGSGFFGDAFDGAFVGAFVSSFVGASDEVALLNFVALPYVFNGLPRSKNEMLISSNDTWYL